MTPRSATGYRSHKKFTTDIWAVYSLRTCPEREEVGTVTPPSVHGRQSRVHMFDTIRVTGSKSQGSIGRMENGLTDVPLYLGRTTKPVYDATFHSSFNNFMLHEATSTNCLFPA